MKSILTISCLPASPSSSNPAAKKTDAQVKAEIAAIIKQITASCTFLPVIEEECESYLADWTAFTGH